MREKTSARCKNFTIGEGENAIGRSSPCEGKRVVERSITKEV
jgi:hypothetical protein